MITSSPKTTIVTVVMMLKVSSAAFSEKISRMSSPMRAYMVRIVVTSDQKTLDFMLIGLPSSHKLTHCGRPKGTTCGLVDKQHVVTTLHTIRTICKISVFLRRQLVKEWNSLQVVHKTK